MLPITLTVLIVCIINRLFFLICQSPSWSPFSFKALISAVSIAAEDSINSFLFPFFPQIFSVTCLQDKGRKFPLELEAVVGHSPSETIIDSLPKIMDSPGIILPYKIYTELLLNFNPEYNFIIENYRAEAKKKKKRKIFLLRGQPGITEGI